MSLDPLCPDPTAWRIAVIAPQQDRLVLHLEPLRQAAPCPMCGTRSHRVHSRYDRKPWDLPWGCWPVQLVVHARRFLCDASTCTRRIFTEVFPQVLARYARQTNRLRQVLLELAHATSAELAARLAPWLGYRVSADTLLGRQRAEPFGFPPPRVLGVDEFALRRGRRYGTLLVDLERRQPVDVLPDTQADTLATWLRMQPQIQVTSRDRAGQFAEGATVGAPQAMPVADRWHLLRNLGEAVQRVLARHPAALRAAAHAGVTVTAAGEPEPGTPEPIPAPLAAPLPTAREQRFREVLARHAEGWSCRRIAQELGLHWRAVKGYILTGELPKCGAPVLQTTSIVIPYLAYLERRWQAGCQVGTQLWQELRDQGYPGSLSSVYRAVKRFRLGDGRRRTLPATTPPQRYALSPRQGMWLLLRAEAELAERDRRARTVLESAHPAIRTARGLAQRFQQMVRERDATALEPWLQVAANSGGPEFRRFAASLRGDEAAVRGALECSWSNGQLEGQINRVKVLKRVGYGRAKLDLFRQRILHRVVAPVRRIKDRCRDLVQAVD